MERLRPTIERVRTKLGTGSPNTINPLLDVWWKKLATRLDSGPAALHRLPESVVHVAESLWLQALDEGRRRSLIEIQGGARANAADRQALEIRTHVLSLREDELRSRVRDRDQANIQLEAQLLKITLLLRKEQLTRESQARRIASLKHQLLELTQAVFTRSRNSADSKSPKLRRNASIVKLRKDPSVKAGTRKPISKRKAR